MATRQALRDELQVVLDVDGVTRRGVTDVADPGVIRCVKQLFDLCDHAGVNCRVAFVSGTPSTNPEPDAPDWCCGNAPLSEVFGLSFIDEMRQGRVSVFGQLGADRLLPAPHSADSTPRQEVFGEVVEGYTHAAQVAILRELIRIYHVDLKATDEKAFSVVEPIADQCLQDAMEVAKAMDELAEHHNGPRFCTRVPPEMAPYALAVRREFDPQFRLVSNGATIEYHDFKTVGQVPHAELQVPGGRGFTSSGIAHREGQAFRFMLVTITNKGATVGKIVDERRKEIAKVRGGRPDEHELEVITIGDTAIDYPMHAMASTPFHVGMPAVWDAHDSAEVAHVALVTGKDGAAPQVDGTISVLEAINGSIVKGPEGSRRGLDVKTLKVLLSPRLMVRETIID